MLTRKQYAEYHIDVFCKAEGIEPSELTDVHCYMSSCLAVSMEFLGMIKSQDTKNYTSGRAGLFITSFAEKQPIHLTAREMLSLLPVNEE